MKKIFAVMLAFLLFFSFAGCNADGKAGTDTGSNTGSTNGGDGAGGEDDGREDEEEEKDGFLRMGMNVGASNYYHGRALMFNDVMKTKHEIGTTSHLQGGYTGEKAADGYPKEVVRTSGWDPNAPVILINDIYSGDYVFLYDGDGDIEFAEGIEVVSAQANKIYLKLTECIQTGSSDPHRRVIIRRSSLGNHIRNMRMIPAEYENKENEMPLFRKDFLDGLKDMHVLRFMDAQSTNNSKQVYWTDRPLVSDWAYDVNGLPFEILIELANTLNADAWFCVPHKAGDDYIEEMAEFIKLNLKSSLKCYIEYSNEIWHTGFSQGSWINAAADCVDEYVKTDLAALRSPSYGTDNRHLKNAYFMARAFRIFERQFSGNSRSRLVTVGTYYYWEYPREIIEYLSEQGLKPDVMAGAGYFNFTQSQHNDWMNNPSSVAAEDIINAVFDIWDDEIAPSITSFANLVKEYDIPYVVYEGGQHMQPYNQSVWPYNQAVYDAQIHPKMYDLYMKNFELHASLGCEMFVNFSYVSKRESQYGSWGVLENTADIYATDLKSVSPKYKAIIDANKKSKE